MHEADASDLAPVCDGDGGKDRLRPAPESSAIVFQTLHCEDISLEGLEVRQQGLRVLLGASATRTVQRIVPRQGPQDARLDLPQQPALQPVSGRNLPLTLRD